MLAANPIHQSQAMNTSKYSMAPRTEPSPPETYDFNVSKRPVGFNLRTTSSRENSEGSTTENRRSHQSIYPPRQPLYIPAALRPREYNAIPDRPQAPDTPPPSKGNSFDSAASTSTKPASSPSTTFSLPTAPLHRPAASWSVSTPHSNLPLQPTTSPSFPLDLLSNLETEPSGPPVTSHWKPNQTSPACVLCHAAFTWYFRRHHCRACGHVVCGAHSMHVVPLDQNARFHPKGYMSRACDACYTGWRGVKAQLQASGESSLSASSQLEPEEQLAGLAVPGQRVDGGQGLAGAEPRSLGVYGNWSTF